MDEPAIPGQGGQEARRTLARAARALDEDGALSTEGLLRCLRAVAPVGHAGAPEDAVDPAFLAAARSLGGDALLAAPTLRLLPAPWRAPWHVLSGADGAVEVRAPPTTERAAEALLLAAGLSLEAAKLSHGLSAPTAALRAAFATPAVAQQALAATRAGGDVRRVELASWQDRVDALALHALVGDRPSYVITGAGAERVHDLLSPFARRLRQPLATLAAQRDLRAPKDDVVYAGMAALFGADGAALEERLEVERADGLLPLGPGAVALRCEALVVGEVDRRCREVAAQLQRARALLVLVEPCGASVAQALQAVGAATRAVAVLVEGTRAGVPRALVDHASGHTVLLDNALQNAEGVLTSQPTLRLCDAGAAEDAAAYSLVQPVLAAQARGVVDNSVRLAVQATPVGDAGALSQAALELLARLGPRPPTRGRSR